MAAFLENSFHFKMCIRDRVKTVLQMLTIIFYYFGTALTWGNFIMIGADCVFLSYWLCWLVAIATAISGIKYLWDNRSFINTAK